MIWTKTNVDGDDDDDDGGGEEATCRVLRLHVDKKHSSHCTMWLSFSKSSSRDNLFLCSHFIEI